MELNPEQIIFKYFPELNERQKDQIGQLLPLYREWNSMVNVVSRKDIEALYLHHVLHSLSIMKFIKLKPGTRVLDLGTGGGFPGIPLAIVFPECHFHLIDGKAKKIKVVKDIAEKLDLRNCTSQHIRSEELKMKFDFVTARAVTQLEKLVPLTQHLISKKHINYLPNGLIALKGGDVKKEVKTLGRGFDAEIVPLSGFFEEEYFNEKYIIYIQI